MTINLTKSIPERLTLRTTQQDREHIAIIAQTMLADGRVFVNYTDAVREALRKTASGTASSKRSDASQRS